MKFRIVGDILSSLSPALATAASSTSIEQSPIVDRMDWTGSVGLMPISVQCEYHKSSAMSFSSENKNFSLWYKLFKTQRPHKLLPACCCRNGLLWHSVKDYWMNFAKLKKHTGHSWKGCFFPDVLAFPNSLQTWNTSTNTSNCASFRWESADCILLLERLVSLDKDAWGNIFLGPLFKLTFSVRFAC